MKNINLLLNKYKKVDKNKDTLKESTKKRCISTALKILKLHRFYNTISKIIYNLVTAGISLLEN